MFKGYKLEKIDFGIHQTHYFEIGNKLYDNYKQQIKKSLDSFLLEDKSLDGSEIIKSWFPEIKAHVFISHSHKDETMVIAFAGWLYERFKIVSFIDSCIWGYANELIQTLDNVYSWLDKTNRIYSYEKVMQSTSHVHMMLYTALSMMIDKTECLIFLDTPNSIVQYKDIDKTESAWIYSEITFSQIVRITVPERLKTLAPLLENRTFAMEEGGKIEKSMKIKYDLYSNHLININEDTLRLWKNSLNLLNAEASLNELYDITLFKYKLVK